MSLEVKDITHTYSKGLPGESKALEHVSFAVPDKSFVVIIGHTGSGKSTLLQHLNGLLKPDSGSIVIHGVDITADKVAMPEIRKKIGLLFQYPEYQLFEETVEKDVSFGPTNLGIDPEDVKKNVVEALELVGFDYAEIADKSPFDLSGGQKRRVAIAGVLAMKPEILILDEPTAGLDPKARRELLAMIDRVHKETGNITLLVSHNMDDAAMLADKVLVMDQGKLAMFDTPENVFSRWDELESMGLGLPSVTALLRDLDKKGMTGLEKTFSIEKAADTIAALIKGKK